jgi:protein SCO1/2
VQRTALLAILALAVALPPACNRQPQAREYALRGQIVRIDTTDGVATIRHEDIKGFMPAMTMPFKVKDKGLLRGRAPGDLVTGKLSVTDTDAWLTELTLVGHADLKPTVSEPPGVKVLEPGAPVPDARLIDSRGRPFRIASLQGRVVALTFIYTRCPFPDYCPRMDRQFRTVLGRVRGDARLRDSVRMLSISFDPEYDTAAVLDAHARSAGADGVVWRFASADRPTIDTLLPPFGMTVTREDPGGITHNLRTAIIDRQGRLVTIYDGNEWSADQMVEDLAKAAER